MPKQEKKSNPKVSQTPDSWRKHLEEAYSAVSQGVVKLARKGGGEFWTAEVVMVRSEVEGGTRGFVVTTQTPDDPDAPGIVSKRLSPAGCAKKLWAIASFHATEYASEHDLRQLRAELELQGVDGDTLNISENSRAVINCAVSEDSVPWMSEDDDEGAADASLLSRLRAAENQNMRLMARQERILDRREAQVSTVISATEQLGAAAAKLVETRLEAADSLAKAVLDGAYAGRLDEYGEQVMGVVLPKLDSFLDAFISKHGGSPPPSSGAPTAKPEPDDPPPDGVIDAEVVQRPTSNQPPGEFFTWVLANTSPEMLAQYTSDLNSAPTSGPGVRMFWGAVLERLGEACAADGLTPPESVRTWARDLAARLTLNAPSWAAEGAS